MNKKKTFSCGQCTKQFFSKSRLDDHINQAHSKSNKCGKCGAQFSHYSSLNRHTKQAHEGVKIGVCKFCKKEFNKRSLERHEDQCKAQNNIFEVLHDETCEIDDDENMEIRTETHHKQSTNTKVDKIDHKCDFCEKTCASGFSLKGHINNVHGEKFLMCINHFNSFNI